MTKSAPSKSTTAPTSPAPPASAKNAVGIEFLAKPFTPSKLLARVREILDAPAPPPAG